MEDNAVNTTVASEEPKQTIAQKVDALNTEKTTLASNLNSMTEGPEKLAAQERIAVIDRKIRWYGGRSGESKSTSKSASATRPSKPAREKKVKPSKPAVAPSDAPTLVSIDS